jgi:hypothetical protein
MQLGIQYALEKLGARPGQGTFVEQIDKLLRELQRTELEKMLKEVDKKEADQVTVDIYQFLPQVKMKEPALARFYLPEWKGYNDVFWLALGDYLILALHSITDVGFDRMRGTLKVRYFHTDDSYKSPENTKSIIKGLVVLIGTRALPTDFTHFRRMYDRQKSIGEISKKEAAIIGGAFELTKFLA